MIIFIPSMDRADRQISIKNLRSSGVLQKYNAHIVVPADQYDDYKKYSDVVSIVATDEFGISRVRNQIVRTSPDNKIIMMDDDLRFLLRPDKEDWSLYNCDDDELRDLFEWIDDALNHYAHCSISDRVQNYQGGSKILKNNSFCQEVCRPYRIYGIRQDVFLQNNLDYNNGLQYNNMDDFHMCLCLLELGYPNVVTFEFATDQQLSGVAGGAESYRDLEQSERCALALKASHPNFVKVVEKETKTSWGGTAEKPVVRKDVVIQWQKSFCHLQERQCIS